MSLTIIGLGPGDADDLSRKAWRALEGASTVYLRTEQHPCVPHLPQGPAYHSFDDLYDSLDDFDAVYAEIARRVLDAAQSGDTVYAVPGDPLVGESTVTRLLAAARESALDVQIVNGISFVEPSLALLSVDMLDGLQVLDAITVANMHHPPINPDYPALLGQLYSRAVASDVKLTLMNQYPDEFSVTLLHGAGTPDARTETVPLYEIDHSPHINHLTSLYVPAQDDMSSFQQFQEVIAHLRAPEGCPWDREQTHESLRQFLLEEAYEVLEAIDNENMPLLVEELGDLLLQVVLHVQIAVDEGEFRMSDVLSHVSHKMVRRHPHVWGDVDVHGSTDAVLANWETIKKAEKSANGAAPRKSILDGIPKGLPALLVAQRYQAKAAKVGFDWPSVSGVQDKIREEVEEIFTAPSDADRAEEIGDVIFVLVNWLRWLGVDDPESVLRGTNAKFYRRFRYVEDTIAEQGEKPLNAHTLAEMDALWDEAKAKGL